MNTLITSASLTRYWMDLDADVLPIWSWAKRVLAAKEATFEGQAEANGADQSVVKTNGFATRIASDLRQYAVGDNDSFVKAFVEAYELTMYNQAVAHSMIKLAFLSVRKQLQKEACEEHLTRYGEAQQFFSEYFEIEW